MKLTKNPYFHLFFWIFAIGLTIYVGLILHNWKYAKFLLSLLFVVIIHELLHYIPAKILGWKAKFILNKKSHYQPAIHLTPNEMLWAKDYSIIAFIPVIPTVLLSFMFVGWIGIFVGLALCSADILQSIYYTNREKNIGIFFQKIIPI